MREVASAMSQPSRALIASAPSGNTNAMTSIQIAGKISNPTTTKYRTAAGANTSASNANASTYKPNMRDKSISHGRRGMDKSNSLSFASNSLDFAANTLPTQENPVATVPMNAKYTHVSPPFTSGAHNVSVIYQNIITTAPNA